MRYLFVVSVFALNPRGHSQRLNNLAMAMGTIVVRTSRAKRNTDYFHEAVMLESLSNILLTLNVKMP